MRSAFVTPTTAMLFSTRDFPFFRKQKNNVSNFKTSRPLHGAISRLLTLPGRFSFCQKSGEIGRSLLQWRPSVSVFVPSCKLTLQQTGWPGGTLQWIELCWTRCEMYRGWLLATGPDLWIYRWLQHQFNNSDFLLKGRAFSLYVIKVTITNSFHVGNGDKFPIQHTWVTFGFKIPFLSQQVHSIKSTIYWHGLFI